MSGAQGGAGKGARLSRHLPKRISFSREFLLETSLLTRQRLFRSQHDLRETLSKLDQQRRRSLDTYQTERRELKDMLTRMNEERAPENPETDCPAPSARRNSLATGGRHSSRPSPRRSISELPAPPDSSRKGNNSTGHFINCGGGLSRSNSVPNGGSPLSPRRSTTGDPSSPTSTYQQRMDAIPDSLMRRYAYIPPDVVLATDVADRHAQCEPSPRTSRSKQKVTSAEMADARMFTLQQRSGVFKVQQVEEEKLARASWKPCSVRR